MRPLKIALFSDSAFPVLNGVSVSVDALLQSLRAQGHSVFLYTSAAEGPPDSDPNIVRFRSIELPWTKDYPLAVPPFYGWFREFKGLKFDIVHTHTPFTVGFVGLRWAQSCEIPVVTTYHTNYDKYVHYVPFFPKRYLRYKIAKHTNFYYNSCDHVITPSEASRRWLMRHRIKRPVSVIPTGIPRPAPCDRDAARASLGAGAWRRVLLYCGRLAVEKNLAMLLETARIVFDTCDDVDLWIVGDGPARAELLELARALGLGDRVRLWGFVPRDELPKFYAAADVFVFPSMTETQGLVVLEAMSYGLPAVVVQGGGASGSVQPGATGFIVPNEPEAMAERVGELLEEPLLYGRLSRQAEAAALEMTVDKMASRVLDAYRSVLGEAEAVGGPLVV